VSVEARVAGVELEPGLEGHWFGDRAAGRTCAGRCGEVLPVGTPEDRPDALETAFGMSEIGREQAFLRAIDPSGALASQEGITHVRGDQKVHAAKRRW